MKSFKLSFTPSCGKTQSVTVRAASVNAALARGFKAWRKQAKRQRTDALTVTIDGRF